MAKDYGDIPTYTESGIRHITKSATECLCGHKWKYGIIDRVGKSVNVTWRELGSVNCAKCKKLYEGSI
jgi:hypothetical protein